ncbi:hypothetical protein NP233_g4894 [Leucocoprinus birnbaumii]|uniref:Uncharacterized protein n=1 Tax=Leucocoprinus birnbaumii TaxID=56174 RepID=A0AAD5VTV1_9AGAR|nr:hypothetical protein NP233_g4894 [Leucocoprinus birnbaumii]
MSSDSSLPPPVFLVPVLISTNTPSPLCLSPALYPSCACVTAPIPEFSTPITSALSMPQKTCVPQISEPFSVQISTSNMSGTEFNGQIPSECLRRRTSSLPTLNAPKVDVMGDPETPSSHQQKRDANRLAHRASISYGELRRKAIHKKRASLNLREEFVKMESKPCQE